MELSRERAQAMVAQRRRKLVRCGYCGCRHRMLRTARYCSAYCRLAAWRQQQQQVASPGPNGGDGVNSPIASGPSAQ